MARIRYIKPEFFDSEKVASVSFEARLLFAGLWTVSDREGRFEWSARRLKAKLFPYDDVDMVQVLDQLRAAGLVVCYEVDGQSYGVVPGFKEHQRPHPHESKSVLPAPMSLHDTASNDGSLQPSVSMGTGTGNEERTETLARAHRPNPYAHAQVQAPNGRVFWEGPIFSIPDGWARRVLKASNGKAVGSDVVKFAQSLTAKLERDGGEVPVAGFLGWLDAEWAAYRQPAVSDGYRPAAEWIEQNRKDAELACSAEEAKAILAESWAKIRGGARV